MILSLLYLIAEDAYISAQIRTEQLKRKQEKELKRKQEQELKRKQELKREQELKLKQEQELKRKQEKELKLKQEEQERLLNPEQFELNQIYDEFKAKHSFPVYAKDTLHLLNTYPNFDVNLKIGEKTLLTDAFYGSTPKVAKTILDHPKLNITTLLDCQSYIVSYEAKKGKLNKTQQQIKQWITNKVANMNYINYTKEI